MLQCCLNGGRTTREHPRLPTTPHELAEDAAAVVALGVRSLHLHPRNATGHETLAATDVRAAITAVRAAAPGVELSVSTGSWIEPDPTARAGLVSEWGQLTTGRPDLASVNVWEQGWGQVAQALHRAGIGIELGIWSVSDARTVHTAGGVPPGTRRILVETIGRTAEEAVDEAAAIIDELTRFTDAPLLLHGHDVSTWTVLAEAIRRGLDTRIGLEDTILLPNGQPATTGNPDLVNHALSRGAR